MKTAICVIIKDENDYLDEWLDYHLNLGIDEIFLYEDYGSKSHTDIVKPYGDRVHLNSIDVIFHTGNFNFTDDYKNGSLIQVKLFNWFPEVYRDKFDWVLFNDIDEFLIIKQPLHDLLKEYEDKPGILLHWRWYGASGHIKKPEGKVMDNYKKYVTSPFDYRWSHKSFVNLKKYIKWDNQIHKVDGGVYSLNKFGVHKAWINHYFTKSWEEWKTKILERGDVTPGNRNITHFFNLNVDMNSIKNELLLDVAIDNANKLGFNKNKHRGTKYLHFCWFGGNPLKEINIKCIDSWKKYISDDFIVCLWNEDSFDCSSTQFIKDAYQSKCWAFVSDYVRLWSVYNFGGVYLDTDIELLKPIDNLPTNFLAIEKETNYLSTGLGFGSKKGNKVIKEILNIYDNLRFNYYNRFDIMNPIILTDYFLERGYVKNLTKIHEFLGFTIYPDMYFCPKNYNTKEIDITDDSISIHHFQASWV